MSLNVCTGNKKNWQELKSPYLKLLVQAVIVPSMNYSQRIRLESIITIHTRKVGNSSDSVILRNETCSRNVRIQVNVVSNASSVRKYCYESALNYDHEDVKRKKHGAQEGSDKVKYKKFKKIKDDTSYADENSVKDSKKYKKPIEDASEEEDFKGLKRFKK